MSRPCCDVPDETAAVLVTELDLGAVADPGTGVTALEETLHDVSPVGHRVTDPGHATTAVARSEQHDGMGAGP